MASDKTLKKAAFLDRDGVLITDVGHLTSRAQIQLLPGVSKAVKKLNDQHVPVVVVTNQSVVGRGLCSEEELEDIHLALMDLLSKDDAQITRFYFCPHHPTAAVGRYQVDCQCRKPKPGMLRQAAQELGIDLRGSVMVGDKSSDIQAGLSAGCWTVLTSDTHDQQGGQHPVETTARPDHIAAGLDSAVDWILETLATSPEQHNPLPQGRR